MRKLLPALLVFFLCKDSAAQTPNWAEHVAPILYANCTSCHNGSGIAPFSLITYTDAYNFRTSIHSQVEDRRMPPWPPDITYRQYMHQRALKPEDRKAILDWIDAGAPKGDESKAPQPPVYTSNRQISSPDLEVRIPDYTSKAAGFDEYRCFNIPYDLGSGNKFITGVEILPGTPEIVHHVLMFYDTTDACKDLDNADPDPGYSAFGGTGSNASKLIGLWAPGGGPITFSNGFGLYLPQKGNIVLQIHFPNGSDGKTDSSRVAFKLNTGFMRSVYLDPVLNHFKSLTNGPLFIPANTTKTFYGTYSVPYNATILSIAPHMHLLGKNIKVYAVLPNHDTLPLIRINNWDFHWQGAYYFKKLLKIPAGAVLRSETFYDNTTNNPENPNDPPKDVSQGESTTDEMMLVYFSYAAYFPGDENIVMDTTADISLGVQEADFDFEKFKITECYPNPAKDFIVLKFTAAGRKNISWNIIDMQGRLVKSAVVSDINENENSVNIQLNDIKPGQYFITVKSGDLVRVQKFIKEQ